MKSYIIVSLLGLFLLSISNNAAGFGDATIDIKPSDTEWNSGEEFQFILVDPDANKDATEDEDLDLFNPGVSAIPTLQIGNPFTLETLSSAKLADSQLSIVEIQKFSQRAMLQTQNEVTIHNSDKLVLTTSKKFSDLYQIIQNPAGSFRGFNFINYDIRSINENVGWKIQSVDVEVTDGTKTVKLVDDNKPVGQYFADLSKAQGLFDLSSASQVQIIFTFNTSGDLKIPSGKVMPIVVDFFSFGYLNDGLARSDRINNMIVRIEAEETGDNTSTFTGTLEFLMLNQINILDVSTYSGIYTIEDDPIFVVHQDMTGQEAPKVNYNDINANGIAAQVSDKEDVRTHSGVISLDKTNYNPGDYAKITLEDQDLNTDSELIDIHTMVTTTSDVAFDTIGKSGLPTLSNGIYLGRMLYVTFDDAVWKTPLTIAQGGNSNTESCKKELDKITTNTGLGTALYHFGYLTSGLVETGTATGIFVEDIKIPEKICKTADTNPVNTNGLYVGVHYVDFRDTAGKIVEVGDSASVGTVTTTPTTNSAQTTSSTTTPTTNSTTSPSQTTNSTASTQSTVQADKQKEKKIEERKKLAEEKKKQELAKNKVINTPKETKETKQPVQKTQEKKVEKKSDAQIKKEKAEAKKKQILEKKKQALEKKKLAKSQKSTK